MAQIRLAIPTDAKPHWDHMRRIGHESGRDGDFIFSPHTDFDTPFEEFEKSYGRKLDGSVLEPGWQRTWVLTDSNGVYGDIHLVHRPPLKSCLHRATLMMGIERSHRGQGFGPKLIDEAVQWAQAQPSLEWLQLYVFEDNTPARALYRKFGFVENGVTPDMFRVHGAKVADISMILRLR